MQGRHADLSQRWARPQAVLLLRQNAKHRRHQGHQLWCACCCWLILLLVPLLSCGVGKCK
jgi:hypothetical protein